MIPFFELFRNEHPELFEEWKLLELERAPPHEIGQITLKIKEFLRPKVEYHFEKDFLFAIVDFRKLINREIENEL